MSYFKLYPYKMMVDAAVETTHAARLFFHLEQYGRVYPHQVCAIELRWSRVVGENWRIVVTQSDIPLQEFDRFIQSLNGYLFGMVHYVPSGPRAETPGIPEEYFFQPVYFDAIDGNIQPCSSATPLPDPT
jgi:hypothetical protein